MTDKQNKLPHQHDTIVKKLTASLKPVKPVKTGRLFLIWFFVSLAATFAMVFIFKLHEHFINGGFFIFSLILLFAATSLTAWTALKMATPGQEPKKKWRILFLIIPLFLIGLTLLNEFPLTRWGDFAVELTNGGCCTATLFGVAVLPLILLTILIFKLAPLWPFWTALLCALAALFMAALFMQCHCAHESACHISLWHYLPIFVGAFLFAIPLYFILKRWRG